MRRVDYLPIPGGRPGTAETLRVMAALARAGAGSKEIRKLAPLIVREAYFGFHQAGAGGVAVFLDRWIRARFKYVDDGDIETVKTPQVMAREIEHDGYFSGDCDDVSMMLASIFYALGIKSRFVAMRTERETADFLHVVCEVQTPFDGWVRLDPTVRPGLSQISYGDLVQYV